MSQDVTESKFVYVTYVRTTPERLWEALTEPEFTRQYWMGTRQESEWVPGASWRLYFEDGRLADSGEVMEIERPKQLVLKWRNEFRPELTEEGYSRATMELEPLGEMVKLTVTHEAPVAKSKFIEAVGGGWPMILSSLKSLMETGEALGVMR